MVAVQITTTLKQEHLPALIAGLSVIGAVLGPAIYMFGTLRHFYIGTDLGELRVMSQGLATQGVYRDVRSKNMFANQLQVNDGSVLYLRSSNRVRIMNNGSSSTYSDLQTNEIMAHSIRVNSETTGDNFYIGAASGELRVTSNGLWGGSHANTIYRNVRASGFTQASSRMYKTNIEKLDDIALNVINRLTVVNYNLIEDPMEEKQVGFISEDSPEIATLDGMAINTYKLTSYNTKAIQELDLKVETREDIILKIAKLEERLNKLKAA